MKARERAGVLSVLAAAVLGHAAASPARETVTGPLLVLDHLFAGLLVVALVATCLAVGAKLLPRLIIAHDSPLETLAFSLALGAGAVSTLLLLLVAVAGISAWVLALVLGVAVALARTELRRVPACIADAAREWRDIAGTAGVAVVLVLGAAMLLLALAPPGDTDSLNYHLRIPAQFLERGRIHLPDDNLHVAWVGLAHFLYLPLLAAGAESAPAMLSAAVAVMLAGALAAAGRRLGPIGTGGLASVLLWGSPIVALVALTPKIDVTFAFFLFLAHVALVRALLSRERGWLMLSAILGGFSVGIKLLALPYLAALAPVALFAVAHGGGRSTTRRLAIVAGLGALVALPWLIKNWLLVGAPFYPELSRPIMPPWLAAIHGSNASPPGLDPGSLAPLREVRDRFNVVDWFTAPARLTPESEGRFYHANPVFALVVLALPLLRQRALAAFVVPAVLYAAMAMVLGTRVNLRYLVPIIPALTLATAWVAAAFLRRIQRPGVRRGIIAALAMVALIGPTRALAHKFARRAAPAHAVGLVSRLDYRLTARDVEIAPYAWLTERVNAMVSPSARMLLLFEPRGYGFRAQTLQDNLMTNWVLLEPAVAAPRCLEGSGITHVLVGTGTLDYFVARGFDPRIIHWDRFPAFAARCLDLVDERPGASLYAVRARVH